MKLKDAFVGLAAAAALAVCASSANASSYLWSYSGGGVSASGWLAATPAGGGVFDVTAIGGTRNGVGITGLASYAGQDNVVYDPAAPSSVDYGGLAYATSGGHLFNVYYDTSNSDYWACRDAGVGYCETQAVVGGDSIIPVDSFTLTAVPEPATWALMMVGAGCIGAGLRMRRKESMVAA
jgi:hypothetical protein